MTEANVNDSDITSFIAQTIEIGGLYRVGTDDDKFIYNTVDNEVLKIALDGGAEKPLAVYGTKCRDAYIVNPFNEGEASRVITSWYYQSRNMTASVVLAKAVIKSLEAGLRANKKGAKLEDNDVLFSKYLGKYVSKVDEKMLKEATALTDKCLDFLTIYYNKTKKRCSINCLIFKETSRQLYPTIRKSTWEVLDAVVKEILGAVDGKLPEWTPDSPNIPVLESTITVFVELMKRLEKPAKLMGLDLSDWANIEKYLPYLDAYYRKARWCVDVVNNTRPAQATNAAVNPIAATIPDLPPVVASNMNRSMAPVQPMQQYAPTGYVPAQSAIPDLPPVVQQRVMASYPSVPVMCSPSAPESALSELPPVVRRQLGY